jgi:plastocyanin
MLLGARGKRRKIVWPHPDRTYEEQKMKHSVRNLVTFTALFLLPGGTFTFAQSDSGHDKANGVAQVVALDECDPLTFNTALGPDFCKNVALGALGFATTLQDLFTKAAGGHPDPGWDFEPDFLKVKEGTDLLVTDQGGEPHTFTEVKRFGGGFIEGLNNGETVVPECSGGFSRVDVAKTRIIQGSTTTITGLSKGTHYFECCIHPWMRVKVEVK